MLPFSFHLAQRLPREPPPVGLLGVERRHRRRRASRRSPQLRHRRAVVRGACRAILRTPCAEPSTPAATQASRNRLPKLSLVNG